MSSKIADNAHHRRYRGCAEMSQYLPNGSRESFAGLSAVIVIPLSVSDLVPGARLAGPGRSPGLQASDPGPDLTEIRAFGSHRHVRLLGGQQPVHGPGGGLAIV